MITPPEPLAEAHDTSAFSCGEISLDDWLRKRALPNHKSGASRTYVVCEDKRVIGYYALAAGAVAPAEAPGRVSRNMPNPIPVMVLGRLAVDERYQGRGLGFDLLRDAVLRTLKAADIAGMRALVVHALSDTAAEFYRRAGFRDSSLRERTLMLGLDEVRKALSRGELF